MKGIALKAKVLYELERLKGVQKDEKSGEGCRHETSELGTFPIESVVRRVLREMRAGLDRGVEART